MTAENFNKVLVAMLNRRPFKPFVIELNGGERLEVDFPNAMVIRKGVAIFIASEFVPIYFDHDSVVQIIDSLASSAPGRPAE